MRKSWLTVGAIGMLMLCLAATVSASPNPSPAMQATAGACYDTRSIDIMLVIDHSGSMGMPASTTDPKLKLEYAREAAQGFLGRMDGASDQAALIELADQASTDLLSQLTPDLASVQAKVTAIGEGGGRAFLPALGLAQAELTSTRRRPANQAAMLLLADGETGESADEVWSVTRSMTNAGIKVIIVQLGDGDERMLAGMASTPADFHRALVASELDALYQSIATQLLCPVTATATPSATFTPSPAPTPTPSATPMPIRHSYLPVVMRPAESVIIQGRVSYGGALQPGIWVGLYLHDENKQTDVLQKAVQTAPDGNYYFTGMAKLLPNQYYYVLYDQNLPGHETGDDRYLSYWRSFTLSTTRDALIHGGSFDIANVTLSSPEQDSTLVLPVTFTWAPRSATRQDAYRVYLYDPANPDRVTRTDPVGYNGAALIDVLPPGFDYNQAYRWYVEVRALDCGFGASWTRSVAFKANDSTEGIRDAVPDALLGKP